MTPSERVIYNRLCKLQGKLFKMIGNIKSMKIALASEAHYDRN